MMRPARRPVRIGVCSLFVVLCMWIYKDHHIANENHHIGHCVQACVDYSIGENSGDHDGEDTADTENFADPATQGCPFSPCRLEYTGADDQGCPFSPCRLNSTGDDAQHAGSDAGAVPADDYCMHPQRIPPFRRMAGHTGGIQNSSQAANKKRMKRSSRHVLKRTSQIYLPRCGMMPRTSRGEAENWVKVSLVRRWTVSRQPCTMVP